MLIFLGLKQTLEKTMGRSVQAWAFIWPCSCALCWQHTSQVYSWSCKTVRLCAFKTLKEWIFRLRYWQSLVCDCLHDGIVMPSNESTASRNMNTRNHSTGEERKLKLWFSAEAAWIILFPVSYVCPVYDGDHFLLYLEKHSYTLL